MNMTQNLKQKILILRYYEKRFNLPHKLITENNLTKHFNQIKINKLKIFNSLFFTLTTNI